MEFEEDQETIYDEFRRMRSKRAQALQAEQRRTRAQGLPRILRYMRVLLRRNVFGMRSWRAVFMR